MPAAVALQVGCEPVTSWGFITLKLDAAVKSLAPVQVLPAPSSGTTLVSIATVHTPPASCRFMPAPDTSDVVLRKPRLSATVFQFPLPPLPNVTVATGTLPGAKPGVDS